MARLKILKDFITGENFFRHVVTGMNFRRTTGAIVWPDKLAPGCVIALGETCSKQNFTGSRRHDVHKLYEFQSSDPSELAERLMLATDAFYIRDWALPLCDMRHWLLEDINDERRKMRRTLLRYGDPLGFAGKGEGLLPFYHALVQRRTKDEKTLFLGNGACADEIAGLRFDDENTNILEFPSAAALCFALAAIDLNASDDTNKKMPDEDLCGPADELGGY